MDVRPTIAAISFTSDQQQEVLQVHTRSCHQLWSHLPTSTQGIAISSTQVQPQEVLQLRPIDSRHYMAQNTHHTRVCFGSQRACFWNLTSMTALAPHVELSLWGSRFADGRCDGIFSGEGIWKQSWSAVGPSANLCFRAAPSIKRLTPLTLASAETAEAERRAATQPGGAQNPAGTPAGLAFSAKLSVCTRLHATSLLTCCIIADRTMAHNLVARILAVRVQVISMLQHSKALASATWQRGLITSCPVATASHCKSGSF